MYISVEKGIYTDRVMFYTFDKEWKVSDASRSTTVICPLLHLRGFQDVAFSFVVLHQLFR